jgi:DNA-binding NarL/FixJ family response regulator
MDTGNTRVFILSNQELLIKGIEYLLSKNSDLQISSACYVNNDVLSNLDNLPPDVAIIDIDDNSQNKFIQVRQIKQRLPYVAIIVLTSNQDDSQLFEALQAQVSAYLSKDVTSENLVSTIARVAHGEHPINETIIARPNAIEQILLQFQKMSQLKEIHGIFSPLTDREMEILDSMAKGNKNKQIASELGIGEQTIKNHITSIMRKLNVNARTEAVVVALKRGIIAIK